MILIKRGSCLLAVVILAFNLCLPLACATEDEETTVTTRAALPSLGWRDTIAAWLMTSGIYPTMTEDDTSFGGWADNRVVSLWNEFVDFVGDSTQATLEDLYNISSYLVDGVMTISKGKWGQLRSFTQFLRDKYALQDNQEGVQIGELISHGWDAVITSQYILMPYQPAPITWQMVQEFGLSVCNDGFHWLSSCVEGGTPYKMYLARIGTEETFQATFISGATGQVRYSCGTGGGWFRGDNLTSIYTYDGASYYYFQAGQSNVLPTNGYTIPLYSTLDDFVSYLVGANLLTQRLDDENIDNRINVDTTIVNTPAALPAESDYGGIRIAGTGEAVTVEALQELIQEAVIEGLQPIINVVGVDLAPDININPDNGDITQDPIEITPDNIPMTQSDYMIPQLHTRFPFSIPWDVFNVLNALNAEPQRPYWDVSLTLPGLFGEDVQIPFTIGVKDDSPVAAPMDRTAAVIRAFVFVLLCVGTLLAVIRR